MSYHIGTTITPVRFHWLSWLSQSFCGIQQPCQRKGHLLYISNYIKTLGRKWVFFLDKSRDAQSSMRQPILLNYMGCSKHVKTNENKCEYMRRTSPLGDLECTLNRHVTHLPTLATYWILMDSIR